MQTTIYIPHRRLNETISRCSVMRRKGGIVKTGAIEENITTVSAELSRSLLGRSTEIFFSLVLPQASQQKFHQKTYRSVFFFVFHLSHIFRSEPLRSKSNKLEQWQSSGNIYGMKWKRILVRLWYQSIDRLLRPSF